MLFRRRVELIEAGILLALGATLAVVFADQHLDRAYILYRYARNLAVGRGLLYNVGKTPFLSGAASAPYAVLLALGTLLSPDLPSIANWLGVLSIGAGGLLMARLAAASGKLPAGVAAGVAITYPVLWVALGLETPLWLALCLAAIALHLNWQGSGAAACLALATLIRADAAVLMVLLAAHSLLTRRPIALRPMGIYVAVAGFGGLITLSIFEKGGILSPYVPAELATLSSAALGANVLTGLAGMGVALFSMSPLWATVLMLCGVGLAHVRAHPWAILLGMWAVLHLVLLGVLGVGIYPWDFAPMIPALAALAALGAQVITGWVPEGRLRWVAWGLVALLAVGSGLYSSLMIGTPPLAEGHHPAALTVEPPDPRIEGAAQWLRLNAPADASVATTRVGLLGYLLDQRMFDYYGALQADLQDAAARGDASWWLMAYSPDYVVVNSTETSTLGGIILTQDDWFNTHYVEASHFETGTGANQPAGSILVYQRTGPAAPLTSSLIGFTTYPGGLTVNGIATDFSLFPLDQDRSGAVRLEWLLDAPIPMPQTVTIRIQGRGDGAVAGLATRKIDFSRWPQHQLITSFHPIQLAPGLPSGVYDVEVGIGPDEAHQTVRSVAVAKVPFQGGTDLGGISGTRAEFGDIALLGYRVGQRPEGLQVFLLWQAERAIAADYHMIIQVRDTTGSVTASQDVQPHSGAYPTSVWSPGEQVTDTVLLPVDQIPPGEYDVYVGLSTPDGDLVRTSGGEDAVFVGHVTLTSQ